MKSTHCGEINSERSKTDRVEIVYYTDPLCCWSWALGPEWKKLLEEFNEKISWRYCLGGMIQDWDHYDDPLNTISRPAQMGPLWMEAMHRSGRKIHYNIWMEDPPASSYPACIAVKSAEMQSSRAGTLYFEALQEAVMCKGRNIAKPEILMEVAKDLAAKNPGLLSLTDFSRDLRGEKSRAAFRDDLKDVRYKRIGRFPTLTITKPGETGIILTGYRHHEILRKAFLRIAESDQGG
ncbi:putative DsbA family dithiol-disulfide isomerase [Anseongella ginsenosidimutans]|uniref:Putative DsbA family dithiol-disulfide isomerase n=1 Tax=Anseongella ginsenosidimutans TaxID=496056 RepID=A0A4R3KUU8_9SPHI|nr:DsbA family protein [Anseongella ginsenosidimutans]TCS88445.1 putative DsbA family dithiol-disulfide isomerase [Anseongella ginsenosidimutans]